MGDTPVSVQTLLTEGEFPGKSSVLSPFQIHEDSENFNSLPLPKCLLRELRSFGVKKMPPPRQSKFLNEIPPYNRHERIVLDHKSLLR